MTDGGAQSTLAEDEARLARISGDLHRDLVAALPSWVAAVVATRTNRPLGSTERARVEAVGAELATSLDEPLRTVLTADVDAATGSPLAVLRSAAGRLGALLDELGVVAGGRDAFSVEHFPDDRHDVGPASFAELDERLHDAGILWGAARAHVHLRRRREREPS